MAINQNPSAELSDAVISERLETLAKAALNGDRNSLFPAVKEARTAQLKAVQDSKQIGSLDTSDTKAPTTKDDLIIANEAVLGNWLATEKKNLQKGVGAKEEAVDKVGVIKSLLNGDYLGLILTFFKDKIEIRVDTASELWNNKGGDFSATWNKHAQESKIKKFAERHGIDEDRLMAEIKNPSQETIRLAQITPEEQIKKAEATQMAKVEAAKAEAEAEAEAKKKEKASGGEGKTQSATKDDTILTDAQKEGRKAQANGVGGGTPADPEDNNKHPNIAAGTQTAGKQAATSARK